MAIKNLKSGVLNQIFHCYNCGRNSVSLENYNSEAYDDMTLEFGQFKKENKKKPNINLEIDFWQATCYNCGWVEI